ncbi:MAG TPA: hypothetical protein VNH64_04300, partial [Parvularculaceae bacterium]|nr:hypothetical protein [Parvularculaceae bacterium]
AAARPADAPKGAPDPTVALRDVENIESVKRGYVTRRLDLAGCKLLKASGLSPNRGDLVLARVDDIGHHRHLELISGRRARLFPGDEILLAFGERYATDQFHARLPDNLRKCHLVAAGGMASRVVARHASARRPTRITPLGLLVDATGRRLNLSDAALGPAPAPSARAKEPNVIVVVGCAMNSGKTTTAANIIRALRHARLRVAACKMTGTGSGGDCWLYKDAGADPVLDFTDAGFASTYNVPLAALEDAGRCLLGHLKAAAPDAIVIEIADGVFQQETNALLRTAFLKEATDSVVFAASDPIGAAAGVQLLASFGYRTSAVSGVVTASPLAAAEAARATGLTVLANDDFESPEIAVSAILQPARADTESL